MCHKRSSRRAAVVSTAEPAATWTMSEPPAYSAQDVGVIRMPATRAPPREKSTQMYNDIKTPFEPEDLVAYNVQIQQADAQALESSETTLQTTTTDLPTPAPLYSQRAPVVAIISQSELLQRDLSAFNRAMVSVRAGDCCSKDAAKRAVRTLARDLVNVETGRRGGKLDCHERKVLKREVKEVAREIKREIKEAWRAAP